MNFLAHALLSGPDPALRLGGLIGDFIKGPLPGALPANIAAGVALHRRIDGCAGAHPAFRRSCARVGPSRRRFAGVMVDMFYDHFLARHWTSFSDETLAAFAAASYRLLSDHGHLLSESNRAMVAAMRRHDWLVSYRSAKTVGYALDRMALRLRRQPNALPGALEELHGAYAQFEADFLAFFPDALAFSAAFTPAREAAWA
ncbi:acyl carrier protein phosphodiesterase [mine drainage metagenome]|uniref:Acyl carrier protein phosphodiesterase n=1 Tax=mine drainage metagenome TaxID=410659 RepID=A0A1J5S0E5_9ZZZZ